MKMISICWNSSFDSPWIADFSPWFQVSLSIQTSEFSKPTAKYSPVASSAKTETSLKSSARTTLSWTETTSEKFFLKQFYQLKK